MRAKAPHGFSMIEVLGVMAVAGVALGGVGRLIAGTARGGGEGELRLKARMAAINALDLGAPGPRQDPIRVEVRGEGGNRVVRATWPGGGLRLDVRAGHD